MQEPIRPCALREQGEQVLELPLKLALNSPDVRLCFHVNICCNKTVKTPIAKSQFIKQKKVATSAVVKGFLLEEVQQQQCLVGQVRP